jgi:hypothetical protein
MPSVALQLSRVVSRVSALPVLEVPLLVIRNAINIDVQVIPFLLARITASAVPSPYK